MTERVVIPLAGIGTLVLDSETYRAALAEGARLNPRANGGRQPPIDEPLLDAEQLAEKLHVPVSWIEQAARENRIPSHQFGRWRRFKRSEVEEATRSEGQ
jgi:excisionase family DNA binding protein